MQNVVRPYTSPSKCILYFCTDCTLNNNNGVFWNSIETDDNFPIYDLTKCNVNCVFCKNKNKPQKLTLDYKQLTKLFEKCDINMHYDNIMIPEKYNVYAFSSSNDENDYNKLASSFVKIKMNGDVMFISDKNDIEVKDLLDIMRHNESIMNPLYQEKMMSEFMKISKKNNLEIDFSFM